MYKLPYIQATGNCFCSISGPANSIVVHNAAVSHCLQLLQLTPLRKPKLAPEPVAHTWKSAGKLINNAGRGNLLYILCLKSGRAEWDNTCVCGEHLVKHKELAVEVILAPS